MSENVEEEEEDDPKGKSPDWDWMEQQIEQAMSNGILQGTWSIKERDSRCSDEYLSAACTKNGEEIEVEVMAMHGEYAPEWYWRSEDISSLEGGSDCPAADVIAVLQQVESEVLANGATF